MPPKVPRLRWDDPLRALDLLASVWSSTGLPLVRTGAAWSVAAPYRTVFTALQQLLIGKRATVRVGDHDVVLTITELSSTLDPRALAVGQLGEVRLAAREITWGEHHLAGAAAVLHNVHIRPGVPPVVVAAPAELSLTLPGTILDEVLRQAAPGLRGALRGELRADGTTSLFWARRPGWGALEVGVDPVGTTLWLRPRTLVTWQRRWKLPAVLPGYPVPLPDLPAGWVITGVNLGPDSLELSALLPEWQMELPLRNLQDLISQLSQQAGASVLSLAWPSRWSSSE